MTLHQHFLTFMLAGFFFLSSHNDIAQMAHRRRYLFIALSLYSVIPCSKYASEHFYWLATSGGRFLLLIFIL